MKDIQVITEGRRIGDLFVQPSLQNTNKQKYRPGLDECRISERNNCWPHRVSYHNFCLRQISKRFIDRVVKHIVLNLS